jgi:hypothetical protein
MDDLLRLNEAKAKAIADKKNADDEQKARAKTFGDKVSRLYQEILVRLKAAVEQFNSRSKAGDIWGREVEPECWEFSMPNTTNVLTLYQRSERSELQKRKIRGKQCEINILLSDHNGYGIHFLYLEDGSTEQAEWVAVRAKHGIPEDRPEPFITEISQIELGLKQANRPQVWFVR